MGSLNLPRPQLSLDLNQTQSPKSVHAFLQEISMIRDVSEKKSKLSMYVQGLEDEMKKIDGLKEVLPLSVLVLNDAIETLKEEVRQCRNIEPEPIIEEFIPLKRTLDDDQDDERTRIEKESRDKKNWLSSVQLGISNGSSDSTTNFDENHNSIERVEEDQRSTTTNPFQNCNKYMNREGAFVPFKGISGSGVMNKKREEKEVKSFSSLPFLMPGLKTTTMEPCLIPKTTSSSINKMLSDTRMPSPPPAPAPQPPQQSQRKQRRCWSPELHRRFVNALQQLGGSQAATPKQIRELMKVDGLTNDEVKSHLQKYRLHTRRNSNGSTGGNQPVVILGGLWVPQDNQYESSKSHSGSPQGPLQLASAMAGNSMDEEEDEKSETYSWKGHSLKSSEDEA